MFDTVKTGKMIKEARIAQNMTQMALADEMQVSFQAVSNWERGNSLPDIAKIGQLCHVLHISAEELLGMSDTAKAIQKVLKKEEGLSDEKIEMKDICKVIPLVPPQKAKELVDDNASEKENINWSDLIAIAPFLESEYIEKLIEKAKIGSLKDAVGLAPFLEEKAIEKLIERAEVESLKDVIGWAPFLGEEALERLALKADRKDTKGIVALAPYLSDKALDKLIENRIEDGGIFSMPELYPYLSDRTLKRLSAYFVEKNNLSALREMMPFC